MSRYDGNDAAGHTALGGDADLVGPLPGIVIHAAAMHDAEHVLNKFRGHRSLARDWVDAVVGQGRRHDGEIPAIHEHRTLAEVDFENVLGLTPNHIAVAHQIGNRAIAVSRLAFGAKDGLIEVEFAPGETRQGVSHGADALFWGIAGKKLRNRNRPGVHHRVVGLVRCVVENNRIKRIPRRLDADFVKNGRAAVTGEGMCIGEWF